jgi:hypothetical protein
MEYNPEEEQAEEEEEEQEEKEHIVEVDEIDLEDLEAASTMFDFIQTVEYQNQIFKLEEN